MDIDTAWVLKLSNFDTTSGGWPLKFTKGQLSHIPWSYFVTWGAFRDATLSLPFSNQMLNFKDHPMPESIGIYWGLLESFEIHWNPAFFVFVLNLAFISRRTRSDTCKAYHPGSICARGSSWRVVRGRRPWWCRTGLLKIPYVQ